MRRLAIFLEKYSQKIFSKPKHSCFIILVNHSYRVKNFDAKLFFLFLLYYLFDENNRHGRMPRARVESQNIHIKNIYITPFSAQM